MLTPLDSIITRICKSNNIERTKIKVHVIKNDEINAFALPSGFLIIYSGLISNANNPEELAGVISHEIAHIELNHVMKKLVKEIGLSALITIATGRNSADGIKEIARILSSTAFDRNLEKEADLKAADYLINSQINPQPFADFLYLLAGTEHEALKYLSWVSTHPDLKKRAEYIVEYGKDKSSEYKTLLSKKTWAKLKAEIKSD